VGHVDVSHKINSNLYDIFVEKRERRKNVFKK